MSGLYNPNFSPARAASPQIRSTPDVDRYASLVISFCKPHHFFFAKDLVFFTDFVQVFVVYQSLCRDFYFLLSVLIVTYPLQSVLIRVISRTSKAWTFHASSSNMQPAVKSRFTSQSFIFGSRFFQIFLGLFSPFKLPCS